MYCSRFTLPSFESCFVSSPHAFFSILKFSMLSDGENVDGGKDLRQTAGEIMAYMKANNYDVADAGEVRNIRNISMMYS